MTYTFRDLTADDLFLFTDLISKLTDGNSFEDLFETVKSNKSDNEDEMGKKVMLIILPLIIKNLSLCKNEIYDILANTTDLSVNDIKSAKPIEFINMIKAFFKKEDVTDFFTQIYQSLESD